MQGYLLFAAPAFFLVTADFWHHLSQMELSGVKKLVVNLILVLLFCLPIRYAIERSKPFTQMDRSPKWASDLRKLNQEHFSKAILFNYSHATEAMFYTDMEAYTYIPSESKIDSLVSDGYSVIINDNGNIPDIIFPQKGIYRRRLAD